MSKILTNETKIRVRFSELDPLGVVWHGNYFKFFEDGRDALGARYGLNYMHMFNHGIVVPLVTCNAEFKSAIQYQNDLMITTQFINHRAAKIHHKYEIWNLTTNKLAATGETVQVFLDKEGNLLLSTPDYFLNWKKQNGLH